MKKIFFYILIIGFVSCKKDSTSNSNNANVSSLIVGKWLVANEELIYFKSGSEIFRKTFPASTTNTGSISISSYYYQFNSDGTVNTHDYDYTNKIYFVGSVGFKYTITNSSVKFIYPDGSTNNRNVNISDNNLTLSNTYSGNITYTNGTATGSADSYTANSNYIKIN